MLQDEPPLSENIAKIVNSSATSVTGPTLGTKTSSYQRAPLSRRRPKRVTTPATNGMPR